MTTWELYKILQELREAEVPVIDDSYLSDPNRWPQGLACGNATPLAHSSTSPWCFELPGDKRGIDPAQLIASEQDAAFSDASIRHAWPLDVFRLLLKHNTGERKVEELDHPNSKIFALGSFYFPPKGHPHLDDGPHALCIRTKEKKVFLEMVVDATVWQSEPGRNDYVLLMASE